MKANWTQDAIAQRIESIDIERMRDFDSDDDSEGSLLVSILKLYLEIAPVYLTQIQTNFEICNMQGIYRAVHNLKSSSANVGANKLALLCKDLELMTEPGAKADLAKLGILVQEITAEFPKVERDVSLIAQLGVAV
jgi:two-component system sensor histidine kinase/response regulator